MKKLAVVVLVASSMAAHAASVGQVVVRQMWPWSTNVDIGFVLEGEAGEDCDVRLEISDGVSPLNVYANSLKGELSNITPGEHHVVWDPVASGVTNLAAVSALKFTLEASPALGSKYMVIDISGGPEASTYPVSYMTTEPSGGFNADEYKLDKIVLRRIHAGMFMMGSPADEPGHIDATSGSTGHITETQVQVLLTNDYYIGVFPATIHQLTNVCVALAGPYRTKASWYTSSKKRPAAWVEYNSLVGASATMPWLGDDVAATSFFGLLRAKTASQPIPSGYAFSLPSEAQWEYACRAGTDTAWNNGTNCVLDAAHNNCDWNADLLGLTGNYKGNASWAGNNGLNRDVGSFLPNAWNLYDMHGLVMEYTCEGYRATRDASSLWVEPLNTSGNSYAVAKGGALSPTVRCRSAAGQYSGRTSTSADMAKGFRIALTRKRTN